MESDQIPFGLRGSQPSVLGLNIPDSGEGYHGLPAAQHLAQAKEPLRTRGRGGRGKRQLDGDEPAEEGQDGASATVQGCPGYSGLTPPTPVHFSPRLRQSLIPHTDTDPLRLGSPCQQSLPAVRGRPRESGGISASPTARHLLTKIPSQRGTRTIATPFSGGPRHKLRRSSTKVHSGGGDQEVYWASLQSTGEVTYKGVGALPHRPPLESLYPTGVRTSQKLHRCPPPRSFLPLPTLAFPQAELHTTDGREQLDAHDPLPPSALHKEENSPQGQLGRSFCKGTQLNSPR